MATQMDTSTDITPFLTESRVDALDNDAPSSASASILSMPDPLSSSSAQVVSPQLPPPHDSDHSEHEFESDSDSESSFPSVTSSFFFSSPASVASHGPVDEEGTGSGAPRELIIPPLTLPEALARPRDYYPLETPHASRYNANILQLLVVGPEQVKQELDDTISAEQLFSVVPLGRDLESVITTILSSFSQNRMFAAVVLVSDSHVMNDIEIAQFAKVISPLVPLIHLNYDRTPSSILSSQNAPLATLDVSSVQELHDALTLQSEASQRLRTEAVEKYLNWAAQRSTNVTALADHVDDLTPVKDRRGSAHLYRDGSDVTVLDSSHIQDDSTVLGIDLAGASGSTVESEATWTQFKAQWEASLEEAYSSSRDMNLKLRRQVDSTPESEEDMLFTARIPNMIPDAAMHGTSTVRARRPSRTKKKPITRKSSSTSSSSLSSLLPPSTITSSLSLSISLTEEEEPLFISADELPSTPLIPPVPLVVAFPFPASSSSHRSSRGTASSSRARSRKGTPGETSPYAYSSYSQSDASSKSFVLDLHTHAQAHLHPLHPQYHPLHPLHLPSSLLALSFSIFAPLGLIRAQLWDVISRKLLLTTSRDRRITDGRRHGHSASEEDKLSRSCDSVDSLDTECNAERNDERNNANTSTTTETEIAPGAKTTSGSRFRFRRALWPTGVMIVGGFLIGFAVGYLSVKGRM